jgi:DNA-binding NarL/FixJ family response regulator
MPATILIVEAHNMLRGALRGWLEMIFPEYRITEATSGREAIALTQSRSPDVVILDISLPDMNGLEATAHLNDISPATPVVILTSCAIEKQYARTRANGANTFVVKNDTAELRSTLETLLSPQRESLQH